jgi:hypothetical protein
MRAGKLATFLGGVLTLASSGVAYAGSAPKELYGKSITVSWSESRTSKSESDQQVRNIGTAAQMSIYISGAGRPFVRLISTGIGGRSRQELGGIGWVSSDLTETAPGDAAARERVEFEGRSIVMYRQFESGARRIAIDVDGTSCKAQVINGREGGKNIARRSGYGGYEILSVQVGAVSCSIREGNVFGQ